MRVSSDGFFLVQHQYIGMLIGPMQLRSGVLVGSTPKHIRVGVSPSSSLLSVFLNAGSAPLPAIERCEVGCSASLLRTQPGSLLFTNSLAEP